MELQLTILYFAAARERAGTDREKVRLPGPVKVSDVTAHLSTLHPNLRPLLPHLRVAVNQEFVRAGDAVPDGAEVALIPPVAGGSGGGGPGAGGLFKVSDQPLRLAEAVDAVSGEAFGGLVTFTGSVRNHSKGKKVVKLDYEAYAPMAERTFATIAGEAARKWPGARTAIIHRVGTLVPGDLAVVIASAAAHRDEAFQACRHAIERLKEDAPIWKREFFEDGDVWVGLGP